MRKSFYEEETKIEVSGYPKTNEKLSGERVAHLPPRTSAGPGWVATSQLILVLQAMFVKQWKERSTLGKVHSRFSSFTLQIYFAFQ